MKRLSVKLKRFNEYNVKVVFFLDGKAKLRTEIEAKIELLAYKKQYPQLENKSGVDNKVMKLIKG